MKGVRQDFIVLFLGLLSLNASADSGQVLEWMKKIANSDHARIEGSVVGGDASETPDCALSIWLMSADKYISLCRYAAGNDKDSLGCIGTFVREAKAGESRSMDVSPDSVHIHSISNEAGPNGTEIPAVENDLMIELIGDGLVKVIGTSSIHKSFICTFSALVS